jgi:rare lipoprotein A
MRLLLSMMILLLSSCYKEPPSGNVSHKAISGKSISAKNSKDGAPAGPAPVSFKKVKPVYEPLSRYGNPDSYAVGGRTYQVMRTASGYKTRGLASWYGTKFHSQRTSSGENYDMYGMTAAHKTLPLPTYVRVKNLGNGREAIVKVNDRGPFHADRVIDLSYAAATKLGLLPKGTAQVEIEALTVREQGKQHVAHYYVQAGAFNSEKLAASFRDTLRKFTPSPVFVEKYQQRFIVKAGPFANKSMTHSLQKQLDTRGFRGSFTMLQ